LLAVLLASATYFLVEKPLQRGARKGYSKLICSSLVVAMVFVLILGLNIQRGNIQERHWEVSETLTAAAEDSNYPDSHIERLSGKLDSTVLFIGDSYIAQLWPRILRVSSETSGKHPNIIFNTAGGCGPIPGLGRKSNPRCLQYVSDGYELAKEPEVDSIVIGAAWSNLTLRTGIYDVADPSEHLFNVEHDALILLLMERLEDTLKGLKRAGKGITIILDPPSSEIASPSYYTGRLKLKPELDIKQSEKSLYLARTEKINNILVAMAIKNGFSVVDPSVLFCTGANCRFSDEYGVPFFQDSTHMLAYFVSENYTLLDHLINPNSITIE
jgi:hypothetical protein